MFTIFTLTPPDGRILFFNDSRPLPFASNHTCQAIISFFVRLFLSDWDMRPSLEEASLFSFFLDVGDNLMFATFLTEWSILHIGW